MAKTEQIKDNTLKHLGTAVIYTVVSVILLGIIYPFVMTGIAQVLFPWQANGSMIYVNGKPVGSAIIGQLWTKPQYFHGRPSAAGKGYDPTSTGATNLGPTSKKLIDSTRATIAALKKENPDATMPVPMDLV
ncbi:MAG TPA: potassium-transporting ATPase subunit C, partial [Candidatus Aquilonibacter sp.]